MNHDMFVILQSPSFPKLFGFWFIWLNYRIFRWQSFSIIFYVVFESFSDDRRCSGDIGCIGGGCSDDRLWWRWWVEVVSEMEMVLESIGQRGCGIYRFEDPISQSDIWFAGLRIKLEIQFCFKALCCVCNHRKHKGAEVYDRGRWLGKEGVPMMKFWSEGRKERVGPTRIKKIL